MHRILILSALFIVIQQMGFSQEIITADEFNRPDGDNSGKLLSTYREFFKWDQYDLALESWTNLFNNYPDASEKLYVDGVTMYRHFIEGTPEGQARENKIDTLMLIYDQRITHFGGEGNVLGRKANELLRYRSSDKEQVQAAYGMLKKSLELEGTDSRDAVMLNFISAGLILNQAEMIDNTQVMEDYFRVSDILDQLEGSSSRWQRTRASIDEMVMKENILSCDGLDMHFGPKFEENGEDQDLLEKLINSYTSAGCTKSDLYASASEKLYELDPGPESAHNLAMLFVGRNDLEKAAFYQGMAVEATEALPDETRAEWFYELSVISLAKGDHCEAVYFAREAIAYKNDYGKAHMALGDAFISSRTQLGDEFQQQTAYWAAADMYQLAARLDPSLSEESAQKLDICKAHFPGAEDIFFHDLKIGGSFPVGGCIQHNTTVRSGN